MRTAILVLAGLTTLGGLLVSAMVGLSQSSAPIWPELVVVAGGAVALVGAMFI